MSEPLDPLIFDLVEWVAREPRTYAEVMDAWRTSCPRLTVWEDAVDRGFLVRERSAANQALVTVTAAGFAFLSTRGGTAGMGAPIGSASLIAARPASPVASGPIGRRTSPDH